MQIITAKDAKSRFGELLDTMQREPVLVTKNKRPVGVFLSLKDVKGTHLESLFDIQDDDYEDWEKEKIAEALSALKSHPSQTTAMKTQKPACKSKWPTAREPQTLRQTRHPRPTQYWEQPQGSPSGPPCPAG